MPTPPIIITCRIKSKVFRKASEAPRHEHPAPFSSTVTSHSSLLPIPPPSSHLRAWLAYTSFKTLHKTHFLLEAFFLIASKLSAPPLQAEFQALFYTMPGGEQQALCGHDRTNSQRTAKELKLREVREPARCHTYSKWQM